MFEPLSPDALRFVDALQRELGGERERLLGLRKERVVPVFVGAALIILAGAILVRAERQS